MSPSLSASQYASRPATHGSKSAKPDASVPGDTRIMIVDHQRAIGKALTELLHATGFDDVRSVLSGSRAIALAAKFQPRIVFLDIELPDLNAYDLARKLINQAGQQNVRVIALTGSIDHPTREEARGAGFERYLVKPVAQTELDKVLRRTQALT